MKQGNLERDLTAKIVKLKQDLFFHQGMVAGQAAKIIELREELSLLRAVYGKNLMQLGVAVRALKNLANKRFTRRQQYAETVYKELSEP